jgi:peptidoglycan hydrolase-like protein with peptidoglycan-binding domain
MADPLWLADVLREAGCKVVEMPGWQQRGHGDFRDIRGVMWHHTGGLNTGAAFIANGRPDLAGPLSQLHLGRDGTFTVICAGIAWHAGAGSWPWLPTNEGNWHLIGIEADSDGKTPYTPEQIHAYRVGTAAILRKLGFDSSRMIGHKEYAAIQGKWDPGGLDMHAERKHVQGILDGGPQDAAAPAGPIVVEAWPLPPGYYYGPFEGPEQSISGKAGEPAAWIEGLRVFQRAVGVPDTGVYDEATKAAAQEVQRRAAFRPDGLIGPGTWAAARSGGAAPKAPSGPAVVQLVDGRPAAVPLPVTGGVSHFAGPGDRSTLNGLMALSREPGRAPIDDWYCAMRWPYCQWREYQQGAETWLAPVAGTSDLTAKAALSGMRVKVTHKKSGKAVVLRAADTGPRPSKRVIDVSPRVLHDIFGGATDDEVTVEAAPADAPLGPVHGGQC